MRVVPSFRWDAQITGLTHGGRIVLHARRSSILSDAREHEGRILWSNVAKRESEYPFRVIVESDAERGWIAWVDSGYSVYYTPIKARDNNRLCLGYFEKTDKRIYVLELHHELAARFKADLDGILGMAIGSRVEQLFGASGP